MLRVCQSCGKTFEGDPAAIKCPECVKKARSTTIRERICRQCGTAFLGGPRAWYCPQCRHERTKERGRQHKRKGSARHLGDTDCCVICGKPYVVKSGLQRYCPDCAQEAVREIDRRQSAAWNQTNTTPESRKAARNAAASTLICAVCGQPFRPDHKHANAVTCSEACRKEYRRRAQSQYGQNNKAALRDKKREYWSKKIAAMTPEEYQARRDRINAKARENYQKRKERKQSQS